MLGVKLKSGLWAFTWLAISGVSFLSPASSQGARLQLRLEEPEIDRSAQQADPCNVQVMSFTDFFVKPAYAEPSGKKPSKIPANLEPFLCNPWEKDTPPEVPDDILEEILKFFKGCTTIECLKQKLQDKFPGVLDGGITVEELTKICSLFTWWDGTMAKRIMEAFDSNKDGVLDAAEYQKLLDWILKQVTTPREM